MTSEDLKKQTPKEEIHLRVKEILEHRKKYSKYYDALPGLGVPHSNEPENIKRELAIKDAYLMDKKNPYIAMVDRE